MAEGFYKFEFDCGRMGELTGTFFADNSDVSKIIGKDVYFGEVLGKHSEVYGTIDEGEITLITDDPKIVKILKDSKASVGFNPFDYLEEYFV